MGLTYSAIKNVSYLTLSKNLVKYKALYTGPPILKRFKILKIFTFAIFKK